MTLPVNGAEYTFSLMLVSAANPADFQVDPTIEVGDFQVSTDDSAFANLTTLPVVTPAGSRSVLVTLSAAEMTGEKVFVQGVDVAGEEWEDVAVFVDVPDGSIETVNDIMQGDRIETRTFLTINKKGTSSAILEKSIGGSLLSEDSIITTVDAP